MPNTLYRLRKSLLLGALFVITFAVSADAPARVATTTAPLPLLWKVSDADNSVYLLGSFHLLKPSDYPLSADVDAAFADAESLVFEISPEEMASPSLGMQMGQAALRSDGTALNSELSPQVIALLDTWLADNAVGLQNMGLSAQVLQLFEPWFVALTISINEMTKQGLDPRLGLDAHLAAQAGNAGKPTAGLETGAQQIAFLDGMGKQEQLQFLAEALSQSKEGQAKTARLHDAWRRGDVDTLWNDMAVKMKQEYPNLYQRINVARNDAWVPRIEQRLRQSSADDTLVVVGALHLLGPDGVVEKLRARGYVVERVCSRCAPER
ncbi:MAG: TraB/GumN family protein [Pseudoxanthomonas sp.]|nr:TraB/GumN family protein [Pseudoxanthomonas sp.]